MTNTDNAAPGVVLAQLLVCAESWVPDARIIGDIRAADISRAIRAVFEEENQDEMVAVPRSVIADLYRFFHQAWEGQGRITEEGSHGKELLDWRQVMSTYHRAPAIGSATGEADAGVERA